MGLGGGLAPSSQTLDSKIQQKVYNREENENFSQNLLLTLGGKGNEYTLSHILKHSFQKGYLI
jgi:hypothetical protein